MSGKKKSPTKKTAQEIREMIASLEEALEYVESVARSNWDASTRREADELVARINKLIGEPK